MKVQKIIFSLISVLMLAVLSVSVYPVKKLYASAYGDQYKVLISPEYDFGEQYEDDFTPFDFDNAKRMDGKSWKPTETLISPKYYEKQLLDFEATSFNSGSSIYFWIYFSSVAVRPITFYLAADDSHYIKWALTSQNVSSTFTKTAQNASYFDKAVYVDNIYQGNEAFIPYGWNLVELKLVSGTFVGLNQEALAGGYNFSKFGFEQGLNEDDETVGEGEILFYNIYKDNSSSASKILLDQQSNCIIKYNTFQRSSKSYYEGEYFDEIPSFQNFFMYDKPSDSYKGYLWIGKRNYLVKSDGSYIKANDISYYSRYFDVELYNITNGKSDSYDFGDSDIKISKGEFRMMVKFFPNYGITEASEKVSKSDTLNLVQENYESIVVSSYGVGIWFVGSSLNAIVGEQYEINYQIHDAFFKEENFSNEVGVEIEDTSVLELVEHKQAEKKIIVKCVGKGSTSIKLTLTSHRLTDRAGIKELTNSNFVVEATEETKDKNATTRIILYVSLGVVGGGSLIYLVYVFIKSRKIDVR